MGGEKLEGRPKGDQVKHLWGYIMSYIKAK